jgi:membrane protease YdiL (CAAX protease family)
MNTKINAPRAVSRNKDKQPFFGVKGEVTLITLGLYIGIVLYYSKHPSWLLTGLGVLTFTAFYLAFSLKYVNPTSLGALHITRKRAGLYLVVGLLLILPGWFFDSLCSYLSGKDWLPLGIASSPSLILSILVVATSEELFFRGYLLGRLKSLDGNRLIRIMLVCAVFMFYKVLVHLWEGWPLASYIMFFAFGAFKMLFETFWVDWTGSIVTPVVIHIGWDLIMFQGYQGLPHWAL